MGYRWDAIRVWTLAAVVLTVACGVCRAADPFYHSLQTDFVGARDTRPGFWMGSTDVDHGADWSWAFDEQYGSSATRGFVGSGHMSGPRISQSGTLENDRMLFCATIHLTGLIAAYRQSQSSWGESRGTFHFKHDWKGDHMAMSDEVSHFFAAFRVQQALTAGYQWTGLSRGSARRVAAMETWLLTFAVEFPIDAYNPGQGFGVSDLLFNTGGVLSAYLRSGQSAPRWDVKLSVKSSFFEGESRLIAQDDKHYGDYIYWFTYRPTANRYIPVQLGLGYSTHPESNRRIAKQIHIGIGTSLDDLGGMISEPLGRLLDPLDFFYFNLNAKVVWR